MMMMMMNAPKKAENDLLLPNKPKFRSMNKRVASILGIPSSESVVDLNQDIQISIQPEVFRFYAYIFFWVMALIATLVTEFITADYLMQGVDDGEPACPPFERFDGKGFDIHTESHLIDSFGFNNICSNWDYSPSREITAMVYPIFEYTLLLYVVADFVTVALTFKKGIVSQRYWTVAKCLFPIMIILCSWFQMCFVILAYKSMRGHTAGFLGLQLVLMMVACLNVWYIVETRIGYSFLGGRRGTHICAWLYLVCDLTISMLKFGSDARVVLGYKYPAWGFAVAFGDVMVGQVVDMIWILFNAILPLIISYVRSKSEQPLEITIDMKPPKFVLRQLQEEDDLANTVANETSE